MVALTVTDAIGPDLEWISGVATAALMNERQFLEKAVDEENDRKWVSLTSNKHEPTRS